MTTDKHNHPPGDVVMDAPEPIEVTTMDQDERHFMLADGTIVAESELTTDDVIALEGSREVVASVAHQLAPMDVTPQTFDANLQRRSQNRAALMHWVRDALVAGTDYGVIRDKPSLWQPGAEKIAGMLGLSHHFPDNEVYVARIARGEPINDILLRCFLFDQSGNKVGEGTGARSVDEDGSLNKAFKMAQKSAFIDAVKRCAGLSEVFTQDQPLSETSNEPIEGTPEADYLWSKAVEAFGEEAGTVLETIAVRLCQIPSGKWEKIPANRMRDVMRRIKQMQQGDES